MKNVKRFKKRTLIIAAALLLMCLLAILGWQRLAHLLDSQRAAERWQGESETEFAQVSCFMAVDEKVSLDEIYTFRNAIQTKLHEAALDIDNDQKLFNDAWSTTGKVNVSSELGKGTVSVTAVGGGFFDFHPLRLLSGSYITADDFTQDRVLLDEDTAWLLFGGTDLQGMSFKIEGVPFVVAGVIQREDDAVSKKAYTSGMGIYMSYDAYMALDTSSSTDTESAGETSETDSSGTTASTSAAGISCYELVLAEPVKNFTYSFVSEKFPIGGGVIVNNSTRYGAAQLLKLAKQFGLRSMQTQGVAYPYWENAARCTEDWGMALLVLAVLTGIMPAVIVAITIIRYASALWREFRDGLWPKTVERTKEAIRVRERKHWEKTHPGWDE